MSLSFQMEHSSRLVTFGTDCVNYNSITTVSPVASSFFSNLDVPPLINDREEITNLPKESSPTAPRKATFAPSDEAFAAKIAVELPKANFIFPAKISLPISGNGRIVVEKAEVYIQFSQRKYVVLSQYVVISC